MCLARGSFGRHPGQRRYLDTSHRMQGYSCYFRKGRLQGSVKIYREELDPLWKTQREEKMRQKLGKTASFHLRTAPKLLLALTLDDRFNPEKRVCSQPSLPGRARELFLGLALSYCLLQTDKHQPRLVIAFKLQPAAMGKRLEDHKYWLTKPWNGSKLLRKGTCWVRALCDLVLTRN